MNHWLARILGWLFPPIPLPPPPMPPPGPAPQPPLSDDLLAAVNAARGGRGLRLLGPDSGLEVDAVIRARLMASSGFLSHDDLPDTAIRGQCVAEGCPTATACVNAWLADGPHRVIVLGGYTRGGGAVVRDNQGRAWWVLNVS